jgi:hypothetical protein
MLLWCATEETAAAELPREVNNQSEGRGQTNVTPERVMVLPPGENRMLQGAGRRDRPDEQAEEAGVMVLELRVARAARLLGWWNWCRAEVTVMVTIAGRVRPLLSA